MIEHTRLPNMPKRMRRNLGVVRKILLSLGLLGIGLQKSGFDWLQSAQCKCNGEGELLCVTLDGEFLQGEGKLLVM